MMASVERRKLSDLVPHGRLGTDELLPPLSEGEYDGLRESVVSSGLLAPIVVTAENVVVDGHHRRRALIESGYIEANVMVLHADMTPEQIESLGVTLNVARRQLSQEQKRAATATLLREDPRKSNSVIAKTLGIDDKTVGSVRSDLEATSEIPKLDTRVGADGKERPATISRHPMGTPGPTKTKGKPKESKELDPPSPEEWSRQIREREIEARRAAMRESVKSEPATNGIDVKAERRKTDAEVERSPWGRLSTYLTGLANEQPPKLSRDEIREAIAGDTESGWFVTARIVRDYLNVVLEEHDAAKEAEIHATR